MVWSLIQFITTHRSYWFTDQHSTLQKQTDLPIVRLRVTHCYLLVSHTITVISNVRERKLQIGQL